MAARGGGLGAGAEVRGSSRGAKLGAEPALSAATQATTPVVSVEHEEPTLASELHTLAASLDPVRRVLREAARLEVDSNARAKASRLVERCEEVQLRVSIAAVSSTARTPEEVIALMSEAQDVCERAARLSGADML